MGATEPEVDLNPNKINNIAQNHKSSTIGHLIEKSQEQKDLTEKK